MVPPKIVLWGVKASPYVRKVMIALAEKDLIYEQKETLPQVLLELTNQAVPVEFMQASPLGKIPALQIDDFCIADSAVISAYLERKFPTKTLLYPANPEAYAKALWFEHFADTSLSDVTYKKIFVESVIKPQILGAKANQKIVEHAILSELPPLLDYINQSLNNSWIAGNDFSMADVAVIIQIIALKTAGVQISDDKWPKIREYFDKVISRPSFNKIV